MTWNPGELCVLRLESGRDVDCEVVRTTPTNLVTIRIAEPGWTMQGVRVIRPERLSKRSRKEEESAA